mgnify:FL=1|jgi:hypothetical protein
MEEGEDSLASTTSSILPGKVLLVLSRVRTQVLLLSQIHGTYALASAVRRDLG